MSERIFRFEIQIREDMRSYETFPIYDDYGNLVGGFTRRLGDLVRGFISGSGYPMALDVSSEAAFYFTPRIDDDGLIGYGLISDKPLNVLSVKVQAAYEENFDVKPKEE